MKSPSKYQRAIFDDVLHGTGNTLVEACPGSGKTYTLTRATDLVPPLASLAYLAFNRSTVEELRKKITRNATIKTVHALGFAALMRNLKPQPKLEADKIHQLMERHLTADDRAEYGTLLKRAVSLAKSHALDPNDIPGWEALIDQFDLDIASGNLTKFINAAIRLLHFSDKWTEVIDHDDMIRLPVVLNLPMPKFDWVFLDEAQDISVSQRLLIARLLKPSSRLLAVGDPRQSIYSFRGASHTSMDELREAFNCKVLPLSISYRCPLSVVEYARLIYPDIEPAPNAIDGTVASLVKWNAHGSSPDFREGDMILCRNNAPLVSMLFTLLDAGISARMLGSDLVTVLTRIVKKVDKDEFLGNGTLLARLLVWRREQIKKFTRQQKPEKVAAVEDHVMVLLTVAKHAKATTADGIIAALRQLFNRDGSVVLSTIHRAKGLEADRVFILDPDLMPSRYAVQDWELVQERNLEYVAVTRARKHLIFIRSPQQQAELDEAAGW